MTRQAQKREMHSLWNSGHAINRVRYPRIECRLEDYNAPTTKFMQSNLNIGNIVRSGVGHTKLGSECQPVSQR